MTKKDKMLLNIVAFLCLMQNDNGLIGKSPDYILEKYKRYCGGTEEEFRWGLDNINLAKLKTWAKRWKIGGEQV